MAFSSGTFSLLVAYNPVVTGTTISSTAFNNTLTDIATGLSTALLKDGTQTATASIPFAQGISVGTNLVIDASGNLAVTTNKFTVTAASGNTAIAGTLTVSGAGLFVTGSIASAAANQIALDYSASAVRIIAYGPSAGNYIPIKFLTVDSTGSGAEQVRINNTTSATRYITLTGSNGGNSEIDVSAGMLSIGGTSVTINIKSGGSTTISTGVGSVKMSTANAATNTAWIPFSYAGTTYYVPAWTTNAP